MLRGNGTTLQSVIDNIENGNLNAKINLVVSDNENAFALERAKKANIPTYIIKNKVTEEIDIELDNSIIILFQCNTKMYIGIAASFLNIFIFYKYI